MDSLTQIVLGAAVAEAVAGRKIGNKAPLWGAIAGTIPDLDVIFSGLYHPIDGALVHRGLSHSILFACLMAPILGCLVHKLYKKKHEQKMWISLFFWGIITHPILDMFTNYGTSFFWPFDLRIKFNTVFIIDPMYTLPFMICLIIAMAKTRESISRRKWNNGGLIYSTSYLLFGVILKLLILGNANNYFAESHLKTRNAMVAPMPFTSFYWMMLAEDDTNYYVAYKSIFYDFNPNEVDTIPKHQKELHQLKWPDKNYSKQLEFISDGYYTTSTEGKTFCFYDLRFGCVSKITGATKTTPVMGFKMFVDNGIVQKTSRFVPSRALKDFNFGIYFNKIFHP